jgi:SHS2 domain-containing protein
MERAAGWERDVKAATYHDAEVRLVDGAWTTTLVLDI